MNISHASKTDGIVVLALATLIGIASFLYPFLLPALAGVGVRTARGGIEVPLLFTVIGVLALALILIQLQESMGRATGGMSRQLALLGALVAVDASLRLMPTLLGASPIFLLIILVGYCYGARVGFLMGALTLLISALITGGLGPWLPYQMLGAGWIGMTAGWLPRGRVSGGWRELAMLAAFGALWGFLFGAILNLMEWPYAAPGLQEEAGLYWTPGMSFAETLATYGRYYLTTSLVYDSFRAAANVALVLILGRPIVRLLDRYRSRFTWQPWRPYEAMAEGRVRTERGGIIARSDHR